jgi:hypothetical protein
MINRQHAHQADNAPSRVPPAKAAILAFDAVLTEAATKIAVAASAAS